MTVGELIQELSKFDPALEVALHSSSEDRDTDTIDGATHLYADCVVITTDDED